MVPFSSYAGQNSGIPIDALTTDEFRAEADALFGFNGSERQARTAPGWLTTERADSPLAFCSQVAEEYAAALEGESDSGEGRRAKFSELRKDVVARPGAASGLQLCGPTHSRNSPLRTSPRRSDQPG